MTAPTSSRRRLGLLMVGHIDIASRHVAGDYPELYSSLLAEHDIDVVAYDAESGQLPDRLDECDGWLCSPSRRSAYDDEPFLRDVEELLRRMIAAEVPLVGICFGHQLLAQALGGQVERARDGWGVGVHTYDVAASPEAMPWYSPVTERVSLLTSHQDQVTEAPSSATVWATSEFCPIAGLAVGERAWTIQSHPEFTPDLARQLLSGRIELVGAARAHAAMDTMDRPLDRAVLARWIANTIG